MQKVLFSLVVASFLAGGLSVLAQDNSLPSAGITPDSPFYFLKTWKENIQIFFTFNAEQKARQYLHLADVRLAEYQKMLERGTLRQAQGKKPDIAQKTLDKYQKQLSRAISKAEELKTKGKDVKDISDRIASATARHIDVLENNLQKVPEAAREGIEKAIENAKRIRGEEASITSETTGFVSEGVNGWKKYTNTKYEFEIQYPNQCSSADQLLSPRILMIECPTGLEVGRFAVILSVLHNPHNYTLEKFYDFYYFVKNPQNREVSEEEVGALVSGRFAKASSIKNIKIDEVDSVKFSYTESGSMVVSVPGPEKIFEISTIHWAEKSFDQILSTFKFLKPQKNSEKQTLAPSKKEETINNNTEGGTRNITHEDLLSFKKMADNKAKQWASDAEFTGITYGHNLSNGVESQRLDYIYKANSQNSYKEGFSVIFEVEKNSSNDLITTHNQIYQYERGSAINEAFKIDLLDAMNLAVKYGAPIFYWNTNNGYQYINAQLLETTERKNIFKWIVHYYANGEKKAIIEINPLTGDLLTTEINWTEKKPDLSIEAVMFTPAKSKLGDTINIQIEVKNIGEKNSLPAIVSAIDESGWGSSGTIKNLNIGEKTVINLMIMARDEALVSSNPHNFKIKVDSLGQVDESNEENNQKIETLYVFPE